MTQSQRWTVSTQFFPRQLVKNHLWSGTTVSDPEFHRSFHQISVKNEVVSTGRNYLMGMQNSTFQNSLTILLLLPLISLHFITHCWIHGEHILYTHVQVINICMYSIILSKFLCWFTDPELLGLSNLIVSKYPYYEDLWNLKKFKLIT